MGTEKRKLQAIAGSYDPASSTKVTKTSKLGRGKTMSAVSDVNELVTRKGQGAQAADPR